jgi:hypothetical protein
MASRYVVIFNFGTKAAPIDKIRSVFRKLKDWLRIIPEAWIVYSDLTAKEIRDRLEDELKDEDPTIVVLKADGSWAAYASETIRGWFRDDHLNDGA